MADERNIGEQLRLFVREARAVNLHIDELEVQLRRCFVEQALYDNAYNVCRTARELGWHRNTLSRNINELHIDLATLRSKKAPQREPIATGRQHKSA